MKLTRSLAAVVIGAASIAVAGTAAAETELVIVSWGGAYSKSQQNAYHLPYMKLNPDIKIINDDSAPEAVAKLRAMNEVNNVTWDLVDAVAADAMRLCDEGLALPIDPDKDLAPAPDGTPASKDFGDLLVSECFIPNIVYSTTFGYRTDKFKTKPTSVCDVFDLKKFPGKRSLEKKPINNFEWALLCDGVAPDKIYDVLGADGGVDRALKKLGTIKSQVIWWTKGAQTPQLLADGEVVIGSTYNGRLFSLIEEEKQPVAMLWDWQVLDLDGWIIPKGTKNLAAVKPGTAQDKRKDGRYAGRVRLAVVPDRSADSLCGFVEVPPLRHRHPAARRPSQVHFLRSGEKIFGADGQQTCNARDRYETAHADRSQQRQDHAALQLRILGRQPGRLHGAVRSLACQVAWSVIQDGNAPSWTLFS